MFYPQEWIPAWPPLEAKTKEQDANSIVYLFSSTKQ